MTIKINGKARIINEKTSILELLRGLGLQSDRVVVEYNFRVVPLEEWKDIILEENGNLEIVSFVGGG
jgi:sulfur carrier protein